MRAPTSADIQRLGFISLVFRQAVQQASVPYPLSVTAILMLHDAVELYALLVADLVEVTLPAKTDFSGYWTHINKAGGPRLGQSGRMEKLNHCRNGLKHHGVLPAQALVDESVADVGVLFRVNTPKFFDVDFDRISMSSLVPQESVRRLLEAAEARAETNPAAAAYCVSAAYEELAMAFRRRGDTAYDLMVMTLGKPFAKLSGYRNHVAPNTPADVRVEKLAEEVNKLGATTEEIRQAVGMQLVGLDLREFARFRETMPRMSRYLDQSISFGDAVDTEWSPQDIGRATDFVVRAALSVAETDGQFRDLPQGVAGGWSQTRYQSVDDMLAQTDPASQAADNGGEPPA